MESKDEGGRRKDERNAFYSLMLLLHPSSFRLHPFLVRLTFRQTEKKGWHVWRVVRVVLLALAVWSLVAWVAARALIVSSELESAEALVVLSGSGAYVERTGLAAQLFKEGRAPKVILTNDLMIGPWSQEQQRNPTFTERAVEELRRAGVPPERIEVLPQPVASTYEEAVLLRQWAVARGLRSILVVTSSYHSRRALWTLRRVFEGSGVAVGLVPVAPGRQVPGPAVWWLKPFGWRMVALEYLKIVYYFFRYR
jgi:uncharacterized SAM-binding protein YcdF (DUF218 family)